MKWTIYLCIIFSSFNVKAQILRFDKAAGNLESFKFGNRSVNYAETGNFSELIQLFDKEPTNIEKIKNDLIVLHNQMPMDENTSPSLFKDQKGKGFYYERNFYDQSQQKIVLQIHLVLSKKGNSFSISTMEFRRDGQISTRNKEIEQLESMGESNTDMPPPPPPPR